MNRAQRRRTEAMEWCQRDVERWVAQRMGKRVWHASNWYPMQYVDVLVEGVGTGGRILVRGVDSGDLFEAFPGFFCDKRPQGQPPTVGGHDADL
jgi:hypothetical protein